MAKTLQEFADSFDWNYGKYFEKDEKRFREMLEKEGWSNFKFYSEDYDSFGPLVRGIIAASPLGHEEKAYYG